MTFGFPAYHTAQMPSFTARDPHEAVRRAIAALGWTVRDDAPDLITATASVNLSSWGETVSVEFPPGGGLTITSRCSLPTQCFDWGKNKRNVRRLIEALHRA